jgi:hypothetical protein
MEQIVIHLAMFLGGFAFGIMAVIAYVEWLKAKLRKQQRQQRELHIQAIEEVRGFFIDKFYQDTGMSDDKLN